MNKEYYIGIIISIIFISGNILIIDDYSLNGDFPNHFRLAEANLEYFESGNFVEGKFEPSYGVFFDLQFYLSYKLFYEKLGILNADAAYNLPIIFIGALGIFIVFLFAFFKTSF